MHELIRRAKAEGAPLIDGNRATFVWKGKTAPPLMGDFNAWCGWWRPPVQLDPVAPGVWAHAREFEPDAYIEYGFVRSVRGKIDYFHPILDPLNPRSSPNGIGGRNSVLVMPGARMSKLLRPPRDAPRGTLEQIEVSAPRKLIGHTRRAWLYRPADAFVTGPCPLLLALDGKDMLRRARLPAVLDNLIAQRRIRPVAALMLDNARAGREVEYHCSDALIEALQTKIVPAMRERLRLSALPGAHGVLGASSGGLAALWIALRMPEVFGKAYALAGAFAIPVSPTTDWRPATSALVEGGASRSVQVELACGTHDVLLDGNRRLHEAMIEQGYAARLRTFSGGHNWIAWRNDLEHGLTALFGQ